MRFRGAFLFASIAALALVGGVTATQPDPNHKVTICHRTDSQTNPYVRITVDEASVDGNAGNDNGKGDHLIDHTGAVWTPGAPKEPKWGDIIPPFFTDGTPDGLPSLNWTDLGQAIWGNDCKPAAPVVTSSPEASSSPETTETPTQAPTEAPTPVVTEAPSPSPEATETPTATPAESPAAVHPTNPPTDTVSATTRMGRDWSFFILFAMGLGITNLALWRRVRI